jgi:hypothetical protein
VALTSSAGGGAATDDQRWSLRGGYATEESVVLVAREAKEILVVINVTEIRRRGLDEMLDSEAEVGSRPGREDRAVTQAVGSIAVDCRTERVSRQCG